MSAHTCWTRGLGRGRWCGRCGALPGDGAGGNKLDGHPLGVSGRAACEPGLSDVFRALFLAPSICVHASSGSRSRLLDPSRRGWTSLYCVAMVGEYIVRPVRHLVATPGNARSCRALRRSRRRVRNLLPLVYWSGREAFQTHIHNGGPQRNAVGRRGLLRDLGGGPRRGCGDRAGFSGGHRICWPNRVSGNGPGAGAARVGRHRGNEPGGRAGGPRQWSPMVEPGAVEEALGSGQIGLDDME